MTSPVASLPVATCLRCGYIWVKRVLTPAQCPHCKNQGWNKPPWAEAQPTEKKERE